MRLRERIAAGLIRMMAANEPNPEITESLPQPEMIDEMQQQKKGDENDVLDAPITTE